MVYMLMTSDGKEIKNTIDAQTKEAAIKYFASLMKMELKILLELYVVKRKNKDK